jgi:Pyruvate/2-oxoacid:ferredoxin oxidoreductase gamma subunit
MEPFEALAWIKTHLEPVFPVKVFRDNSASAVRQLPYAEIHPWLSDADLTALFRHEVTGVVPRCELAAEQQVKIGGFGGQGVMLVGTLLADCAVARGLNATWLPSYGPEMRGGTSNASVIISKDKIGSPVVNDPNVLIAMNTPSLELFENSVQKGGMILVNSSLIAKKVSRSDVTAIYVPATDLAKEENFIAGANIIMLTVYLLTTGVIDIDTIRAVVPVSTKKRQFAELNLKMIERGKLFFESSTD